MSEIIKEPISGAMIDLFAGAGGLSCGLEQAGFHPVLANEMVEQFANTYKVNHPTTRVVVGDVRNVDEKELHSLVAEHSRIDLIAGGPPCQGFSVNAPIRSLDDPRNHLFEEYLRIVDEIRPKAVLIENVPGIVSLGKGTVVEQIYKALENMGYKVNHRIILMCGTTMEKTARTYFANTEEELRDHLLATLNTHYESATGETFRKIGKTDIHIEFENKAAFIGECKIWHGERLFQGAIQQVINYSTWRDMKVSVIIFNKENQSFPAIISKIKSWADSNTVSYTQPQANIWKCKYHRQDMNVDIQLMILAFDLYVDKSQFKDSRYEN